MITCVRCHKEKENVEFDNDKSRLNGKYSYCKDCRREYNGSKKLVHRVIGVLDGLIVVKGERYPEILTEHGRMKVHLYVAEKMLGRKLVKGEVVHHRDGNKENWSENNLQIMDDHSHRSMEAFNINRKLGRIPIKVICKWCRKVKKYSSCVVRRGHLNPKKYRCRECSMQHSYKDKK